MEYIEKYFLDVIVGQFADFKGKATRKQFWFFFLCNFIVALLIRLVTRIFFGTNSFTGNIIGLAYLLIIALPYLSITVRRLHDRNFSGWWLLVLAAFFVLFHYTRNIYLAEIIFITVIGLIWTVIAVTIFIELVMPSKQEDQKMNFPKFIKTYFVDVIIHHYADFKGKATRKQFWFFLLINSVTSCLLTGIGLLLSSFGFVYVDTIISKFYLLGMLIPLMSNAVRRLHDIDRRGWWILTPMISAVSVGIFSSLRAINVIPKVVLISASILMIITLIICFVFLITPSKPITRFDKK
jgi:uncharacterized membrane protein YhaH (DUF805 family)